MPKSVKQFLDSPEGLELLDKFPEKEPLIELVSLVMKQPVLGPRSLLHVGSETYEHAANWQMRPISEIAQYFPGVTSWMKHYFADDESVWYSDELFGGIVQAVVEFRYVEFLNMQRRVFSKNHAEVARHNPVRTLLESVYSLREYREYWNAQVGESEELKLFIYLRAEEELKLDSFALLQAAVAKYGPGSITYEELLLETAEHRLEHALSALIRLMRAGCLLVYQLSSGPVRRESDNALTGWDTYLSATLTHPRLSGVWTWSVGPLSNGGILPSAAAKALIIQR